MLKQDILCFARQLGIDQVAVCSAILPQHYLDRFADWIQAGHHADMAYLAKRHEDQIGIDNILPKAKSAILLASNYYHPEEHSGSTSSGLVSRYARTRDYHKILGNKVKKIAQHLRDECQAEARGFVDVGPVLERAYAEQAGLGFIGKSSMLITRERGTWVFLGIILTTLELEPDQAPENVGCGSCTRCIKACPTGAIIDAGVVDSRRCISYHTIEKRGGIPKDLRSLIGNRIFGCDACQDACPHNRRTQRYALEDYADRRVPPDIPLEDILNIETNDQFLDRFAGTPIMRAKRFGLLRNACVAAGNSADPTLISALEAVAKRESDPILQEHAHWAISKLHRSQ